MQAVADVAPRPAPPEDRNKSSIHVRMLRTAHLELRHRPAKGLGKQAMAIAALVYLISPIDAVPDFIPVLGLLDDAGVILATVASLAGELSDDDE